MAWWWPGETAGGRAVNRTWFCLIRDATGRWHWTTSALSQRRTHDLACCRDTGAPTPSKPGKPSQQGELVMMRSQPGLVGSGWAPTTNRQPTTNRLIPRSRFVRVGGVCGLWVGALTRGRARGLRAGHGTSFLPLTTFNRPLSKRETWQRDGKKTKRKTGKKNTMQRGSWRNDRHAQH